MVFYFSGRPPRHLLPRGLSSLLKLASLRWGLGTLGTDIWKLFSLGSVPPRLFTHLLMCCARPVLSRRSPVLPPMLPDGCRERGRAVAPWFPHGQVSPRPTPEPRSFADAVARPLPARAPAARHPAAPFLLAQPAAGARPGCTGRFQWYHPRVPYPARGDRPRDAASSPGCDGDQKRDERMEEAVVWMGAPRHGAPGSRELAGPAHGKGCWLLLRVPAASCGGPVWGDARLPNQPPLPGSSVGSGGGPCAAVSKPGAACAPWMSPQAGKPLLVPAMPLPQGKGAPAGTSRPLLPSDPAPGLSSCCKSPFNSFPLAAQRVLPSLCFRVNSELKRSCLSPSPGGDSAVVRPFKL